MTAGISGTPPKRRRSTLEKAEDALRAEDYRKLAKVAEQMAREIRTGRLFMEEPLLIVANHLAAQGLFTQSVMAAQAVANKHNPYDHTETGKKAVQIILEHVDKMDRYAWKKDALEAVMKSAGRGADKKRAQTKLEKLEGTLIPDGKALAEKFVETFKTVKRPVHPMAAAMAASAKTL